MRVRADQRLKDTTMNAILAAIVSHASAAAGAADAWLESLHPHMAGIESVQLLSIAVLSWLGGRVITGGRK